MTARDGWRSLSAIQEAVREDATQPETWKDRNGARLKGWRRSEVHRRVLLDWVERMQAHLAHKPECAYSRTLSGASGGRVYPCTCGLDALLRELEGAA